MGSPRKEVIENAIRDLNYHAELLDLLRLPEQQDKDAVMILHMGGVFGDKAATLDRFRENYARLAPNVKKRLVLENDDVSWSVHDLLPVCEELNIPMVLDYHHHNIIFDADKLREGTRDIMDLYPRIKATWDRKGITQKMHYSEPTPAAITGRQRRKHNPRPATLPPCPPNMDLMIEAKDKEQAVFELMKTFKLPGYDSFNDLIPHVRNDDNKPKPQPKKKKAPKKKKKGADEEDEAEVPEEPTPPPPEPILEDDVGMGGPEGRVYWPPGMEEWLRPKKREVKKKDPDATPAKKKKGASLNDLAAKIKVEGEAEGPASKKAKAAPAKKAGTGAAKAKGKASGGAAAKRTAKNVPTPSTSDAEEGEDEEVPDLSAEEESEHPPQKRVAPATGRRQSGRATKASVSYAEAEGEDVDEV